MSKLAIVSIILSMLYISKNERPVYEEIIFTIAIILMIVCAIIVITKISKILMM